VPHSLETFINKVIPELQNRGIFRTTYEGTTLRENLGLARPVNKNREIWAARYQAAKDIASEVVI
jgi:N-acetyl-S-(2-succino)cysteine monooxygenase